MDFAGCRAEKHPNSCAEGAPEAFRAEKGVIFRAEWDTTRLPSGKMPQFPRRGCRGSIWGGKRCYFPRRIGYPPPPEQKNAPIPARRVPLRHLGRKKASFSARNGIPTACRAGKHPNSCAEGAPEVFREEKGIGKKILI